MGHCTHSTVEPGLWQKPGLWKLFLNSDDFICNLVKTWLFGNFSSQSKLDDGNFLENLGEKKCPFQKKKIKFHGSDAQKLSTKCDLLLKL